MREAVCLEIARLVMQDAEVAAILSDISLPYFKDAFEHAPDRTINVGIMEQTLVGVAAGFALEGFHPIAHTIAPFLVERPFEQLKIDFGYQGLGGTFVGVGGSFDYAVEGATHHSPGDVALVATIPGFEIATPGTADEAVFLLRQIYRNGRPTYLRLAERQNPTSREVQFGRIEVIRSSIGKPAILAVGSMLGVVEEAASDLEVTVLYATTVAPLDLDTLARESAGHLVVVTPFLEGTLSAPLLAAFQDRPMRITNIGAPRAFVQGYGSRTDLERVAGLDAESIRQRLMSALDER